jgi:hypothetical protein
MWYTAMTPSLDHFMIRLSAGPYGISYGSRQVGHATKIRAPEPRKQKHDRRDVELILKLPVENRFGAIWMPYEEQLDLSIPVTTSVITGCGCARKYKCLAGHCLG